MHPDRKIGIAMGILLVGVVGALFFRNEPLEEDASLAVRRESELNERLRERDVAVYVDTDALGPVGDTDDAESRLEEILGRQGSRQPSVPLPVRRDTVVLSGTDDSTPPPDRPPLHFDPPHELLSPVDTDDSAGQIGAVATGRGLGVDRSHTGDESKHKDSAAEEQEFDEYTVRFGDTLSEISERFLGSQSRYREIYDANRDRMSSPDQLKVGKAIRIPRVLR